MGRPLDLVRENLQDIPKKRAHGVEPGGRHLMVMSENDSALGILLEEGIISEEDTELILGA